MEYECVQCFREFETDPGEEPCEKCRAENEARNKAWPHRVFDDDWDRCKAWSGDWECGYDTDLGDGCHECIIGQLAAKVAELEKCAVREGWVVTGARRGGDNSKVRVAEVPDPPPRPFAAYGVGSPQFEGWPTIHEAIESAEGYISAAEEASNDPPS